MRHALAATLRKRYNHSMKRALILSLALLLPSPATYAVDDSVIDASGLPLPRFVSLRSNDANMRVGPGKQYPIKWHYQRAHLPMEVVEEFGHWRRLRDKEGELGWMHKNLLSSGRFVITESEPTLFHIAPRDDASVIIKSGAGVLVYAKACELDWCLLTIQERDGWARKSDIWGVYETEQFRDE